MWTLRLRDLTGSRKHHSINDIITSIWTNQTYSKFNKTNTITVRMRTKGVFDNNFKKYF